MGWIIEEEGLYEAHEGHVAYIAPDGRHAEATTRAGLLIRRAEADRAARRARRAGRSPHDSELYDLVPWAELDGWQAACSCGWSGSRWDRAEMLGEGLDPEEAQLPDGRFVFDAAEADWLAHINPLRARGRVAAAAQALAAARRDLDLAVDQARRLDPPPSWAEIGRATGMTRQAARERWSTPNFPLDAQMLLSIQRPADFGAEFDGERVIATEERLRRRHARIDLAGVDAVTDVSAHATAWYESHVLSEHRR